MPHFASRYEVFEVLGTGGWGVVRRAWDHHLNREVALKMFSVGLPLGVAVYEAQLLTALESPHILRVFNADRYQDVPYLATEIAPLRSAADRAGGLGVSPELAIRWVRQMLVGLEVCHRARLLHRDIKPSNIFLQSEDLAQLGDLGLAELMDADGRTPPHGTYSIRAPEAFTLNHMTVASDVYSAGLALYILLTGVNPFDRPTYREIEQAVVGRQYPAVREAAPHVPRVIAMRVDRAMSLDPANRYQSAAEFHDDLGRVRHLDRVFRPITPHAGHLSCWMGWVSGRGHEVVVCVRQMEGAYDVEVLRAGGARTHLRRWCKTLPNLHQLGVHLRRTFDTL